MNTPDTQALTELIQPMLNQLDVQLIDVKWKGSTLRIVVDRQGGIDLDACEQVSTAVSALLDAYDPITVRYSLEVSSPGAERPLASYEDWKNAVGRRVHVRYSGGEKSELNVEGRLVALETARAEIEVRDKSNKPHRVSVDLDTVIAARITVDI